MRWRLLEIVELWVHAASLLEVSHSIRIERVSWRALKRISLPFDRQSLALL